jgi:hypothetical protein
VLEERPFLSSDESLEVFVVAFDELAPPVVVVAFLDGIEKSVGAEVLPPSIFLSRV